MLGVGVVCLAMNTGPAEPPGGGGCSQGCHVDQFWKVGAECIKADVPTCCVAAWALTTGGTYGVTGGPYVDHWSWGDNCIAVCPDKNDSTALPFAVLEYEPVLWGSFPECECNL